MVAEEVGADLLVTDGLKPGERIIVEGVNKAREGAPVTAMTAREMAARSGAAPAVEPPDKQ